MKDSEPVAGGLTKLFQIPADIPEHQIMENYLTCSYHTVDELSGLVEGMQDSEHPAVNFVAAQAALHIALLNPAFCSPERAESQSPSLDLRLAAIDTAAVQLVKAESLYQDFADARLRPGRRKEALNLTLLDLQTQASRPNIEIAASWLAGQPDFFSKREIMQRQQETASMTVRLCQEIQGWPPRPVNPFDKADKERILAGLALSAVAQISDRYLIIPPILYRRSEHQRSKFSNMGFTALSAEPPYWALNTPLAPDHQRCLGSTRKIGFEKVKLRPEASLAETIQALVIWTETDWLVPELEKLADAVEERLDERVEIRKQALLMDDNRT